ncbi:MAG: glycosyltransferase family 1 protein [Synechococcales cyanobacterium RU_4_20]|nr:glycosyltransferase family 1 protein [Synechococcales cyanobacterium RU_4_20]
MRITILTVGSRGDIQPYLALALRLKAVGYEVCIATEQIYQAWITQEGIKYAFLPGNSKELHANEAWFKLLEETDSRPILSAYRAYREFLLPTLRELLDAAWEACQGSDVILSLPTVYAGSHIAEKLGIPCFTVWTCPFTPTRYFPHAWSRLPSQQWAGGALNRFSYWIPQLLDEKVLLPTINQWRQDTLGLPPSKRIASRCKPIQRYTTIVLPSWQNRRTGMIASISQAIGFSIARNPSTPPTSWWSSWQTGLRRCTLALEALAIAMPHARFKSPSMPSTKAVNGRFSRAAGPCSNRSSFPLKSFNSSPVPFPMRGYSPVWQR